MSRLPPGSTSTATLFPSTTLFRSAFLAAATLSPDGDLGAGMLATGAGVALTSHLLKSGARAMMNTSPEPVSNWTASFTEDAAVVGALALAFAYPWLALAIVVARSEEHTSELQSLMRISYAVLCL